jgi:NADH:ubiquinone oxidoreductase subunit 6 (subunit J)
LLTAVLCAVGAFGAIQVFGDVDPALVEVSAGFGNIESVGRSMLSDFVYPFEVISLILLVAVVGVVLLAKKVI